MKKLLSVLVVVLMLFSLSACEMLMPTAPAGEGTETPAGFNWMNILMLVGIVVIFYFLMIRPQRNKDKKQKEMLGSMDVGDGVTTIGGIVGRIVSMKDDTVLVETGSDRTKLRFQKWAIQTVEKLNLDDNQ